MRSPAAAGHARIANRMLRRVRDFAQVKADGVITKEVADQALCALEIDHLGSGPHRPADAGAIIENYGGARWAWRPWRPPSARRR